MEARLFSLLFRLCDEHRGNSEVDNYRQDIIDKALSLGLKMKLYIKL